MLRQEVEERRKGRGERHRLAERDQLHLAVDPPRRATGLAQQRAVVAPRDHAPGGVPDVARVLVLVAAEQQRPILPDVRHEGVARVRDAARDEGVGERASRARIEDPHALRDRGLGPHDQLGARVGRATRPRLVGRVVALALVVRGALGGPLGRAPDVGLHDADPDGAGRSRVLVGHLREPPPAGPVQAQPDRERREGGARPRRRAPDAGPEHPPNPLVKRGAQAEQRDRDERHAAPLGHLAQRRRVDRAVAGHPRQEPERQCLARGEEQHRRERMRPRRTGQQELAIEDHEEDAVDRPRDAVDAEHEPRDGKPPEPQLRVELAERAHRGRDPAIAEAHGDGAEEDEVADGVPRAAAALEQRQERHEGRQRAPGRRRRRERRDPERHRQREQQRRAPTDDGIRVRRPHDRHGWRRAGVVEHPDRRVADGSPRLVRRGGVQVGREGRR